MSLRVRINLLITVLTVGFLLAVVKVAIDDTRRSIREEMEGSNRVTLQLLSTIIRDARVLGASSGREAVLVRFLRELGRVRAHDIVLRDYDDRELYASPPSVYKVGRSAPDWFVRLVRPDMPAINIPVAEGNITVTVDSSRSVLDAWDDLKSLTALVLAFLVAVNLLVFFLVGRSLRPVRTILDGLSRMERGELHARLPSLGAPEFESISHTFNRMADTLERSQAENRRLALVAQQSGDAILIEAPDGTVSYWNPAAERLFGYAAADIVGMPAEVLELPKGPSAPEVERRPAVDHVETQCLHREGRAIDVALTRAPMVDPSTGETIGVICSMRDITELKRARETEAELAQNRRLTHLIQASLEEERRTIARELHDELGQCATAVRTIGTVIAQKTAGTQPEIHQGAQTIVTVAGRIYDSLHGIIRKLRPSALDHLGIAEALEEAVSQWRALHPGIEFGLVVRGSVEGGGESVNITVYRIVQECLNNIVKHARATRAEIRVERGTDAGRDCLIVTVSDNGRGLAEPEALRATRFGVMGMRERAEALGGDLKVESRPGAGVTVMATVPLRGRAGAQEMAEEM
ncbi:MAG: PAS domain S-box protein [Burkholderiales bacterium]